MNIGLPCDPQLHQRDGKLLTLNMNKPDEEPVELTLVHFNRTGFNPHGISLYQHPSSGAVSLFVVNHRPDAQAVEIFDFIQESHLLVHRRSVVDKLIYSPNNVQAVGNEIIYHLNAYIHTIISFSKPSFSVTIKNIP